MWFHSPEPWRLQSQPGSELATVILACAVLLAPGPPQQQGPFSKPNDGSGACSADVRPEERFLRSIADCLRPGALALYAAAFPLTGPGHILMVCFHLSFGHSALLPETAICVAH